MFPQQMPYWFTFVLILYMRLFLESHAVSDICSKCKCDHGVNCASLGLTSVPDGIPKNATYLYLQLNKIGNIEKGAFEHLTELKTLDLRWNNIGNIEKGAFENLTELNKLLLDENNIMNLEEGTFEGLTSLTHLDLDWNKINNIEKGAFEHLTQLGTLELRWNKIGNIEKGAFEHLTKLNKLNLYGNDITNLEKGTFEGLTSLTSLDLVSNKINNIEKGAFEHLTQLETLYLQWNKIGNIEKGAFEHLTELKTLNLGDNNITNIAKETFQKLTNLTHLYLKNNQLKQYEDGAFLFLSKLTEIDLSGNNNMMCGCHLPAFVNYMKNSFNRHVDVLGKCRIVLANSQIKLIGVLEYSQCENYTLFQGKLQCQTCSGVMCNDSEVTSCPNMEPVCRYTISMKGVSLKFENSCSTYKECLEAERNNTFTCNKRASRTSSVACCIGNLCKKKDFIGWTNFFVFYLIHTKNPYDDSATGRNFNGSQIVAEKISRAMERDFLTMTGAFKVKYCGSGVNTEIFTISCLVQSHISKDQVRKNITNNLNISPTMRNVGIYSRNMELIGERWTNFFVFYLIHIKNPYDDSATGNFNGSQIAAENISRSMERDFVTMTGAFKVKYCGSMEDTKIFTISCLVPSHISNDQVRRNITNTLNTSQILHNLGIHSHNMELISELLCKENTTTKNDILYWPRTKVGTTANIPCHANVATRHCSSRMVVHQEMPTIQYMTTPKCSLFTGIWQDPDMSQCNNTEGITRQLKDIKSKEIDKQNIEDLSKTVLDLSQKSMYFKEEYVDLAVGILENMVPLTSNVSANISLNNIVLSINNMINTPEKSLVKAEQSNGSVNRMLDIMEAIPEKITLEGEQITVLYSNIGIGAAKVEEAAFNGLFYGISFGNNETESKSVIYDYSYPDLELEEIEMMDYISLPKSILKHLKDEERSAISRISFSSMQDEKLYKIIQESNGQEYKKLNSHIIAAHIPNIPITDLDEPVNIALHLIHQDATKPQCVYWDRSAGQNPHWSTKGCNIPKYVPGEKVLCSCNRLGSFALLMDVYQNKENIKNIEPLSLISNFGFGISIVFLILTLIFHVCFKNLWKLMASKILVNLCSSLAITNLIFVVGMQEYVASRIALCKTVAALLHYFLMTSLIWMTAEARHVYLASFVVSKTYEKYFMVKSSILAWGLPAFIVITTLVINNTKNYIKRGQFCWLSDISFYAAFLSPVVIVLLFNLTTFSLAIWRLITMQKNRKLEHKTRKVRVFGIVGLFLLLGLSWVSAFFAFGAAAEALKYLFVVFNTLQAMFVFLFYCVYKKDTRDVLSQHVYKGKKYSLMKVTKNKISSGSDVEIEVNTAEMNL